MGACLSCLGLDGPSDHDSNDDAAPLLDPTFQPSYGTHDSPPHHLRERDPEAVRRENAALEHICVRVSSRLVDVMHDEADDAPVAAAAAAAAAATSSPATAATALIQPPDAPSYSSSKQPPPSGSATLFQESAPDVRLEKDKRESLDGDESKGGKRREVSAWLQSVIEGGDPVLDQQDHVGTTPLLSRGAAA